MPASFSENNLIDTLYRKADIKSFTEDMFFERQDVLIQHPCDLSVSTKWSTGSKCVLLVGHFLYDSVQYFIISHIIFGPLSLNDPLAAPLTRVTFIVCSQDEKNSGMNTAKSSLGSKFSKKDISPTWSLSY